MLFSFFHLPIFKEKFSRKQFFCLFVYVNCLAIRTFMLVHVTEKFFLHALSLIITELMSPTITVYRHDTLHCIGARHGARLS